VPAKHTSVRWAIVALLILASFVAYLLRQNISVAAKFMMPELGLSELQMGWVFGAYSWGYALFQFPGGLFGEAYGGRRALAVTALLWVVITLLTGIMPGRLVVSGAGVLATLIVLRFLLGAFQAPTFPIMAGVIGEWFPVGSWALPNGMSSTGLALGAAAAAPFVAWAMITIGWRESFIASAPIALLMIGVWWWYATDTPAQHPRVGPGELALILADRRRDAPQRVDWKQLAANREILLLSVSYFAMNYVFYFFSYWFYIYLTDVRGFGILAGGFYAAAPWLTGAVCASLGGWLCERLCRRLGARWGCRVPGIAGLVLVALFLGLGAVARNPYVAVVLLALCFGSTQLTEGAYWQGATYVAGPHTAGASGVMNTGGNMPGIVVGPLIPILVQHFGWPVALVSGSMVALVGAAIWLLIRVDRPFEPAADPS